MPRESVRVERIDAKRESMRRDSRCQERCQERINASYVMRINREIHFAW